MATNPNLNLEIGQLKSTIQKETADLSQKESASRASVAETSRLLAQIKIKENEIKQKESEIQRIKMDVQQMNNKISISKNNFGLLSTSIATLKRSQMANAQQLRKLEVEMQDSLRRNGSNKKSF